ncbi:MAG: methylenetetrahydrofolate reductase [Bacteroidales bacterium]|jgi:methylenetetrahydrofolate reductase (NADPH)|nr:methylenetetrahydrofolate reductase [Bacteroidales bacterium]
MNVAKLLRETKETLFTFEILPPLKGGSFEEVENTIKPLLEFNPAYINITSHRNEVAFRKTEFGNMERYKTKKRPGSVGVAAAIKHKFNIEVVPHLICAGFTKDETEDALIDYNYLGLNNLFVIRGDKSKSEPYFITEPGGYTHAVELLSQIQNMNNGIYLDLTTNMPTAFSCGVAGYPEGYEENSFEKDLLFLKEKIDKGAEYIVTQMFFDNQYYYNFVKSCRKIGIDVPIVPGLKPISLKNQMEQLPKLFNIHLPEPLLKELQKCTTDKAAKQVGTQWCIQQCKDLKANKVPSLHIYTYGVSDNVFSVCKNVY